MRIILLMSLLACAPLTPTIESDLLFCKEDQECALYRTNCGQVVSYNFKYRAYVVEQFKSKAIGVRCESGPDTNTYRAICESNTCTKIESIR